MFGVPHILIISVVICGYASDNTDCFPAINGYSGFRAELKVKVKTMPNPKPKMSDAFRAQQKPKYGDKPLGATMGIRFPEDIDQVLRQMSDRQDYIRKAVEDRLRADGLLLSP